MTAKPFCDGPFSILKGTSWIVGKGKDGDPCHILDQRGWGYLTGKGHAALALDTATASAMQAETQQWVVDAMNAAWNRRADLAAVQPAQVRVKPLVWEEGKFSHQDMFYAETEFGPWLVVCYSGRGFRWTSTDTGGDNSENDWDTADAAKAEAQADYEARILAALEPQPDPRDEVIARLVDALEMCPPSSNPQTTDAEYRAAVDVWWRNWCRAALAEAKAVQHG